MDSEDDNDLLTFDEICTKPGVYRYSKDPSHMVVVATDSDNVSDTSDRTELHERCTRVFAVSNNKIILFDDDCSLIHGEYEKVENLDYRVNFIIKE